MKADRDEVLRQFPLEGHLANLGIKLQGSGSQRKATTCAAKAHKNGHWCVSIDLDNHLWHCNDCDTGGSIVDWIAIQRGVNPQQIYGEMVAEALGEGPKESSRGGKARSGGPGPIVATYDYTNELGELVFQVTRHEPKDFRQRRPGQNGEWIYDMEGVQRVLYHLVEVLFAPEIFVTEGEADVESLRTLGFTATCNVGGAKKWLDGYTESLRDKDVVLCGDTDKPGKEHIEMVRKSIEGKVKSARTINIPAPHKDVRDYIETFANEDDARFAILALYNAALPISRGIDIPVQSVPELEPRYVHYARNAPLISLDLANWLPRFGGRVRPLVPGELVMFISDTGVGKTSLLTNLALHAAPLCTLFFELELPETLIYERTIAAHMGWDCREVEERYRQGPEPGYRLPESDMARLSHLFICPKGRMSTEEMESLILRSELKTGRKVQLVLFDYIQLAHGVGQSRYEIISNVAEELKQLAKVTQTIIVCASQIARKPEDAGSEVKLNEGKGSGSIENSSGLVLGAWRDPGDQTLLYLKVLKNTKGKSGLRVACTFDGPTMRITERAPISRSDVPGQNGDSTPHFRGIPD